MIFKLLMNTEKKEFPIDYRRTILSFIKNALSNVQEGKYLEEFYRDTIQKDYCFSVELPKPTFKKDIILLESNNFTIKFSTSNNRVGFILQNAFMSQSNVKFKIPNQNCMTLKKIILEKNQTIKSNKVIFRTDRGSSICVREHDKNLNSDKYYTYEDQNFNEQFKLVIKNQAIKNGFSKEISENIEFTPIDCKKVVVKHYGTYIDATVGVFELIGDSRLLQFLYEGGMASRKSSGFGMVHILNQILD